MNKEARARIKAEAEKIKAQQAAGVTVAALAVATPAFTAVANHPSLVSVEPPSVPDPKPAEAPKTTPGESKPKKPPKPPQPKIAYVCGHEEPLRTLQMHPCPACVKKHRVAKAQRTREKRLAARQMTSDEMQMGRLPANSRKDLFWNGAVWHGILGVPDCPAFTFNAPTEVQCFHGLDRLYREHLAQQQTTASPPADGVA